MVLKVLNSFEPTLSRPELLSDFSDVKIRFASFGSVGDVNVDRL